MASSFDKNCELVGFDIKQDIIKFVTDKHQNKEAGFQVPIQRYMRESNNMILFLVVTVFLDGGNK